MIWRASDGEIDRAHVREIRKALDAYRIQSEERVGSAHKSIEHNLRILNDYRADGRQIVYCTTAGRSDGLSGSVAGHTYYPVVACPPPPEDGDWDGAYPSSSIHTPSHSCPMFVRDPNEAARAMARIFALSDRDLQEQLSAEIEEVQKKIELADREARKS